MREILFRGKRLDNGEWVKGNLAVYDICDRQTVYVALNKVIPATVGQYTGLCDKNGKKIFEGDILEFRHGSRHPVFWDNFICAFGSGYYTDFDLLSQYKGVYHAVVGNIHDNPELLEVDNG